MLCIYQRILFNKFNKFKKFLVEQYDLSQSTLTKVSEKNIGSKFADGSYSLHKIFASDKNQIGILWLKRKPVKFSS